MTPAPQSVERHGWARGAMERVELDESEVPSAKRGDCSVSRAGAAAEVEQSRAAVWSVAELVVRRRIGASVRHKA